MWKRPLPFLLVLFALTSAVTVEATETQDSCQKVIDDGHVLVPVGSSPRPGNMAEPIDHTVTGFWVKNVQQSSYMLTWDTSEFLGRLDFGIAFYQEIGGEARRISVENPFPGQTYGIPSDANMAIVFMQMGPETPLSGKSAHGSDFVLFLNGPCRS